MAASRQHRRTRFSVAAKVAVAYAVFGAVWIYASDELLRQVSPLLGDGVDPQTYKGWLFIAVSSGLLFLLLRGGLQPGASEGGGAAPTRERPVLYVPLLIFALLASAIAATGYLLYHHETTSLREATNASLKVAVESKAEEVLGWFEGNRADLRLFARGSLFANEVPRWQAEGAPFDGRRIRLLRRMETIRAHLELASVALFDPEGRPLLLTGLKSDDLSDEPELARRAMAAGSSVVSDIHILPKAENSPILVDMAAPLIDEGSSDRGVHDHSGVLLFRIDVAKSLFPLLLRWPAASTTGEFLLVRKDGDDVLYMNELRHRPGTAMRLRMPLYPDLLCAAALRGESNVVCADDYRGVQVLSVSRRIPGTDWLLIAKVDSEEVYGPIRRVARLIGVVVSLFIAAAGMGVLLWWRQQQAQFQAQQLRLQMEREALVRHFDFLARYANDIILMIDDQGRIVEANARAEREYGYPRDQLLGLDVAAVGEASGTGVDLLRPHGQSGDGVVYEARHRRQDGSLFPVEVSSRIIEVGGRRFRHDIIRDIGERVAAELKTRELLDQLRRINTANILGEMISVLTHELRQPLTAALNYINASRRWSGAEAGRAAHYETMSGKAADQIRRADELVRRLRGFIQKRDAEFTAVDIVSLIEQTMDLALLDGVATGLTSRFDCAPALPQVHIDAVQIQQVLLNLLRNAVDALVDVPHPDIVIEAHATGPDYVEVAVRDNGAGLPAQVAEQVFQPFVSSKPGGIGMGLSICHGIIQAHGGRLWWEQNPAGGTVFRFTLPVARALSRTTDGAVA